MRIRFSVSEIGSVCNGAFGNDLKLIEASAASDADAAAA